MRFAPFDSDYTYMLLMGGGGEGGGHRALGVALNNLLQSKPDISVPL